MIFTERLKLCPWRDDHRAVFAEMHADAGVMADQGGPIDRPQSDAKLDHYMTTYRANGLSRWAVERPDRVFLGYAGVMPRLIPGHPLGPHFEIGWRFLRHAWGKGYATESARAALTDAFRRTELPEILSYTSVDNLRSQAVMARLNLQREPSRDFIIERDRAGAWHGMVWVARSR
jgi:RimJ/RimL family protein N-acetyltransferase